MPGSAKCYGGTEEQVGGSGGEGLQCYIDVQGRLRRGGLRKILKEM